MKLSYKQFKRLSSKQSKTYAAVILLSILSLETFASGTKEPVIAEPWMVSKAGITLDEELVLEEWMMKPFETTFEKELVIEDWMLTPFETVPVEEIPVINCLCTPAP